MKYIMQLFIMAGLVLLAYPAYAFFEGSPGDYRVWLKRSLIMLPVIAFIILFYIAFYKELLRRAYQPDKALKHVRAMAFLGIIVAMAWIYQGIIPFTIFVSVLGGLFAIWFLFFFLFAAVAKNKA